MTARLFESSNSDSPKQAKKYPAQGWVFMIFLPRERWFRGVDI